MVVCLICCLVLIVGFGLGFGWLFRLLFAYVVTGLFVVCYAGLVVFSGAD